MLLGHLKSPAQAKNAFLVAIVGGSGAGKTWLADQLQARFGKEAGRLSLDSFYRDRSHLTFRQRARLNFDHPRAIDWELVHRALDACREGRAVRVPRYSFAEHTRLAQWDLWRPKPVVFVDGLWLLRAGRIRRLFGLRIFIECPERIRLERRLRRDAAERSRSESSVRQQFRTRVLPMHCRYVDPQRTWADVILSGRIDGRAVDAIAEEIRKRLV